MGPWATVIVAFAAVLAAFLSVMAFRGLVEILDGVPARCRECGRMPMLPLPAQRTACWRCRHHTLGMPHLTSGHRHHGVPH